MDLFQKNETNSAKFSGVAPVLSWLSVYLASLLVICFPSSFLCLLAFESRAIYGLAAQHRTGSRKTSTLIVHLHKSFGSVDRIWREF
jgi:hypothetical protein